MITENRVTVTDAATSLNTPTGAGRRLKITNGGGNAVDLGGPGVVSGEGYELDAGASLSVELVPGDQLFGISADGQSNEVQVLET